MSEHFAVCRGCLRVAVLENAPQLGAPVECPYCPPKLPWWTHGAYVERLTLPSGYEIRKVEEPKA